MTATERERLVELAQNPNRDGWDTRLSEMAEKILAQDARIAELEAKEKLMICGHPNWAAWSGDDGTNHCRLCRLTGDYEKLRGICRNYVNGLMTPGSHKNEIREFFEKF